MQKKLFGEFRTATVIARVVAMGDLAVKLRFWVWAKNPADAFVMNCDLLQSIKTDLLHRGI